MTFDSPMQAIFAHRGASHDAPENTLKAFQLAMQQGADGIELDVHLTADRHVAVIHDYCVERTTDGRGRVEQMRLEDLRKLDAGEGERIPTLGEVLELVGTQLTINIELKSHDKDFQQLPKAVLGLVADCGLKESVVYSSFSSRMLIQLHKIDPDAKVGFLLPPGGLANLKKMIYSPFVRPWSLNPHFRTVNHGFMRQAKASGLAVFPWTVNKKRNLKRMFSLGVTGVITNFPLLAREIREALP